MTIEDSTNRVGTLKEALDNLEKATDTFLTSEKKNQKCWQLMDCPKEEMEICPAVLQNAERRCWLVAGTMSGRNNNLVCVNRAGSCKNCEYYLKCLLS
ncbi:two-CW domain-containing protein [Candidatus Magnetomonas plexicatena]|uniref:two-CW domain-containing protein n=1 Tax=Candidatus Magnetomonas plexicatena TaxID=2552947 RepID=UPI001C74DE10|nr:hypothetical protein E2O03_000900 [Nitrospirales bacterium LBB_01]